MPAKPEPVPAPVPGTVPGPSPEGDPSELRYDLAEILAKVPREVLGFDTNQLPKGLDCRIARARIRPGIFPDKGHVLLKDVIAALPGAFQSVFASANLDHELIIPLPVSNKPRLTTAAVRLAEDIPASAEPKERAKEKTSAVHVTANPTVRVPLAPLVIEAAARRTEPAKPSDKPANESPSVPTQPTAIHQPSTPTPMSTTPSVPSPAPATSATPDDDFGMDFRQLELRAVFGLASVLPAGDVFKLALGLPGVKAAGYMKGGALVFEQTSGGAKLEALPAACTQLAKLAGELGIKDSRLLTLQTEGGILAIFNEGGACLAVHHEGRRFAPGVRERLVIILRELARS